jgi:hypothetical protein
VSKLSSKPKTSAPLVHLRNYQRKALDRSTSLHDLVLTQSSCSFRTISALSTQSSMSPSWNPQLQTLFRIVPNLCHLRSKSTVKSNMRSWPSLTPRSTANGSAGYCTSSAGQGMGVQMKNTPGCQLQNLNTLKNSSQTSMPNTHGNLVPFQFDFPTPTSSNTHTPFKKTSLPIHSTLFHSSPHHLILTIPP